MRFLRSHHITKLVAIVDSFLPRAGISPRGGRPVVLHCNEVIALLLFSSFVAPQRIMKGVYTWAQTYYYRRFRLCSYPSFVRKCHQALPGMAYMLDQLLAKDASIRFMDSTMLHVCRLIRANRHKVAKDVAGFGKNWQGWHYPVLLDGKLKITPNDWMIPIAEVAKSLRVDIERVRTLPEQGRNKVLEAIRLKWYTWQDSNLRPLAPQANALSS